jgi:hypothetical protein
MRLPSRSAQIKPTSRLDSVAFVIVASVLGGIILLDEERGDKEPSSADADFFHQCGPSAGAERLPKSIATRDDINMMRSRTLVFAFFAAAMLFSVVREWSAPSACPRLPMIGKVRLR